MLKENDVGFMTVAIVTRRQLHIIPVSNPAKLFGIRGTLENVVLKDNIFMRNHYASWVLLIKPSAVRVHTKVAFAEYMTDETERRKHDIMQNVIAKLRQTGVNTGETKIRIDRKFTGKTLQ